MLKVMNDAWTEALDRRSELDAVHYMDIRKAFGTVPYKRFIL